MKIVHVCLMGVFCEKYAYQDNLLPKYHKKLGNEVTIIAPTYAEAVPETGEWTYEPEGISIIGNQIKLIRIRPALPVKLNRRFQLFWGLEKAIESQSPDIIFVHGVSSLSYRHVYEYCRRHPEVKIAFDNHADFNNSCQNFLSRLYCKLIVKRFVVKRLIKISNHFYGVTPARCDFLREMYGVPREKISLLPMGADDEEMHLDMKQKIRDKVRAEYDIKKEDFLIVTGGKIDSQKNIHRLAEAVINSGNNIKLLVFGSIKNEMKPVFNKLQSDRIHYIGWQPSNQVYRFFYAADLVMFPGLHSVLWEQSVASKVPCAFSRIKGFEHIDIGGNCILMDEKTADYYQKIIGDISNNVNKYQTLYNNAQNEKSMQFLYSKIADKVLKDLVIE